jgi:hypothetical protein
MVDKIATLEEGLKETTASLIKMRNADPDEYSEPLNNFRL